MRPLTPREAERVRSSEEARVDAQFMMQGASDDAGIDRAELADRLCVSRARLDRMARSDGSIPVHLLGEAMRATGRRLRMVPVRVGADDGTYRHWVRNLAEAGLILRRAEEAERLAGEVARHLAAAEDAESALRDLDALAAREAAADWGEAEVSAARRESSLG